MRLGPEANSARPPAPDGGRTATRTPRRRRHPGFDCSSLVRYAYWPDDPVFRLSGTRVYHVGLRCGDDEVIHAPRTGRPASRVPLDEAMPRKDYYGATRLLHLSAR
ncbi:hypothetical protein [Streptomyces sp. WG7]|uniref:hypothetical protein n=1 Tax=Streptomyces sp. WG7 TaxID=3417650 RepID=UPI003CFB79A0